MPEPTPIEDELKALAAQVPEAEWPKTIAITRCRWCGEWLGLTATLDPDGVLTVVIAKDPTDAVGWSRLRLDSEGFVCRNCLEYLANLNLEIP